MFDLNLDYIASNSIDSLKEGFFLFKNLNELNLDQTKRLPISSKKICIFLNFIMYNQIQLILNF